MVNRLNQEIRRIMADPAYKEKVLNVQGLAVKDWTPEEFDAFVRNELKDMADLINFLGIKPE